MCDQTKSVGKGYVRQILPFSAVDGPGNRAVIFFQGCNMRCLTCHNPETIPAFDHSVPISVNEVLQGVLPYRAFIDGVTITGGECTLQGAFLKDLVEALYAQAIPVLIDSNGLQIGAIEDIKGMIEGVMLDIKSADAEEHLLLTGVPFDLIQRSALTLLAWGIVKEIRTVVHPDLAWETTLSWVAKHLQSHPHIRYKVIGFRSHGVKGNWQHKAMADKTFMARVEQKLMQLGVVNYLIVT